MISYCRVKGDTLADPPACLWAESKENSCTVKIGSLWLKATIRHSHWHFSNVFRIVKLSSSLAVSTSNAFCHLHLARSLCLMTVDHDLASVVYTWVASWLDYSITIYLDMKLSTYGKFWTVQNTTARPFCNPGHCDPTVNFLHFSVNTCQTNWQNSRLWHLRQVHWASRRLHHVPQHRLLSVALTVEISMEKEKIYKNCRTLNFPVLGWNCDLSGENKSSPPTERTEQTSFTLPSST